MSNAAHLIANDTPGGAAGEIGWSGDAGELLADGPHAVPVFWLALFDEGDLVEVPIESEDGEPLAVPSLATPREEALHRFQERRALLSARFPEFEAAREAFETMLQGVDAHFIKVDVAELWDLAAFIDEDFDSELRDAVRWFESRDEDDFERLLSFASIHDYDLARRSFPGLGPDVPRAFHLCGYPIGFELEDVAPGD